MRRDLLDTSAGPLRVTTDGDALLRIELGARGGADGGRPSPFAREALRQLAEYFAGKRTAFTLPWSLGPGGFRNAVLERVARIPWGHTLGYGDVAAEVGNPRAARAVGQAVGANPLPVVIPCHRVLAAGGRLGGFGAGLRWKRALLAIEGIEVGAGGGR